MQLKDVILEESLNREPRVYLNSTDEDFLRTELKNGLMLDKRRSNLEDLSIACMELLYKDSFTDEHKDLLNRLIILGYSKNEVKSYVYKYCKYEVSLELIITVCREIIGDYRWAITSSYLECYEVLRHLIYNGLDISYYLENEDPSMLLDSVKTYPRINGLDTYEILNYIIVKRPEVFKVMILDCLNNYKHKDLGVKPSSLFQ